MSVPLDSNRSETTQLSEWVDKVAGPFAVAGEMCRLLVKVLKLAIIRPFGYWGEVRDQCYNILKLCWFPLSLASFGFGFGAPGVTGGAYYFVLGAANRHGGFFEYITIREFGPVVTFVVVGGVIGTAMTADLGARRVRDEIDAMAVLGIDPVRALVLPRVIALTVMTVALSILSSVVGLASGYAAEGGLFGANFAAWYGSLFDLLNLPDLWGTVVKCGLFGLAIGIICTYLGLNAKGGAIGVGRAVNIAVVSSYVACFIVNLVFTTAILGFLPEIMVYK